MFCRRVAQALYFTASSMTVGSEITANSVSSGQADVSLASLVEREGVSANTEMDGV